VTRLARYRRFFATVPLREWNLVDVPVADGLAALTLAVGLPLAIWAWW
jgi:hypothetical protein